MFFIGATGQLLTLILTVCLPLILIANHPVKANNEIAQLSFNPGNFSVAECDATFSTQVTLELIATEVTPQKIDYPSWFLIKNIFPDIGLPCVSVIPSNRFNKAPPVVYC